MSTPLEDTDTKRTHRSVIGLVAGLLLTVIIVTGGFSGLLLAIVLGGIGWIVGLQLDGVVDVRTWVKGHRD